MAPINLKECFDEMQKCFECAVCMDHFKDPRSLDCQHQFCKSCLHSLVNVSSGNNTVVDRVKCPTCREITQLRSRKSLNDLPRPTLLNTIHELVDKVLGSEPEKLDIVLCDICMNYEHKATSFCLQCNKHLCEPCHKKHEGFQPLRCHITIPLLKELVCQIHDEVYIAFCETCKSNLCSICLLTEHSVDHKITDYHNELLYKLDPNYHRNRVHFHNLTSTLKGKLKELEEHFDKVETDICSWYTSSKAILREKTDEMLKELLSSKVKQSETFHTDSKEEDSDIINLKLPYLGNALDKKIDEMKDLLSGVKLKYNSEKLSKFADNAYYPIEWTDDISGADEKCAEDLSVVFSLKLKKAVTDIQFDEHNGTVVVKTKALDAPIKTFTYKGEQIDQWGTDIKNLNPEGAICLDTKRNVILVACNNSIAVADKSGYIQDNIRLPLTNKKLCGIAYSERDDLYAVTDSANHCLLVVDPRTNKVVRRCGQLGNGNFHFEGPYCIQFNEKRTPTTIIVSDVYNHCAKVFDLNCTFLHSFGAFGYGKGMLDHPRGIAVDQRGRAIICDQFNHRVVRHWTAEGKSHSETILNTEQLDNECPWAIGYSEKRNLLGISFGTGSLNVYSGYGNNLKMV